MSRAGLSPERVVAAGLALADAEGLAAVTVSALARHFGVQVPSMYAHVRGADDLASRLGAAALDELADRVAAAVAGRAGRDALLAMAGAYREYAAAHPGRWRATRLASSSPSPPTPAALEAGRRHSALGRAVLRGYGLSEPEATHAVRLVGSLVTGWVDAEGAGSFAHSEPAADASWRWSLDVLDAALSDAGRPEGAGPTGSST